MSAHPQPRTDATGIIDEHLDREQAKARASSQTAYDRLRALTRGAKGDRPDYGNFISCADATAIVEEIDRLRAGSATPASSDVLTAQDANTCDACDSTNDVRPDGKGQGMRYCADCRAGRPYRPASIAEDTGTRDVETVKGERWSFARKCVQQGYALQWSHIERKGVTYEQSSAELDALAASLADEPRAPAVDARVPVGEAIANARAAAGLTQAELAALAGTTQARVCEVETSRSDVRLSTITRLADALKLSVRLIHDDDLRGLNAESPAVDAGTTEGAANA